MSSLTRLMSMSFAMFRIFICVAAFSLSAFSLFAAPVPKSKKVDLQEQIQGSWELIAYDNGRPAVAGAVRVRGPVGMIWTFEGENLTMMRPGSGKNPAATYKIDADETPAHFEWRYNANSFTRGIVEIDGDTMKISYSGSPRPTDFTPKVGQYLYTFRRVEKQ